MKIFKNKRFALLIRNFLWLLCIGPLIIFGLCLYIRQRFILRWEIMVIGPIKVEMSFIIDLYGSLFSFVVLLISSSVVTFSINYMSEDPNIKRFIIIVLLFIMSINLLIFIPNLVAVLLGWDGLGIVSFALVIYYQNPSSLAAGIVTALANRVGDVMLIISIAWITIQGHWNFITMFDTSYSSLLTLIILLAAMTKRAQIPFSSWLPAAMAAPTPVSALVHSSTLVTAGVFLLIRFYFFLEKTWWFNTVCLAIASLTCLIAGLCAIQEFDIKKIIALSTLSQLGVIITRLGLGAVYVAYFHIVTHALFKALLFICAGNVIHQHLGSQDIRFMGNIWKTLPSTSACLNIANLALCGMPFLAGFYSKDLILELFFIKRETFIMLLIIIIRTIFTMAYSVRFSLFILWGEHKKSSFYPSGDEDLNVNLAEQTLSLGAIMGGALFSWAIFSCPEVIVLTLFQKITILVLLVLTLAIIVFLDNFTYYKNSINLNTPINIISHSLRTMWFLSILFAKITSYAGITWRILLTKVSDQGWREMFGGQGALISSKSLSGGVMKAQNQFVSLFLFMSFFAFTLILLIF